MIISSYLLNKNGTKGENGEPGQIVNVVINFLLDLYVLVPNILQIFLQKLLLYFIFLVLVLVALKGHLRW